MSFIQGLETINSVPYAGKTVTMSFYARAGANFSPTSNAFNAMIYTGTGTDQFPTGYTGGASVGLTTFNITTTWVRYSITGTIPTTATEFGTYFYWVPTGTAGTNDYVEITGVQVEVGSVATPFKTYAGTLQGELAACQRYYWRYGATGGYVYAGFGSGSAASTTQATIIVQNPVPMRVAATSIDGSTLALTDGVNAAVSVTSTTLAQVNELQNAILANVASGLTQYRWYRLASNNSANGYLGFSAEL